MKSTKCFYVLEHSLNHTWRKLTERNKTIPLLTCGSVISKIFHYLETSRYWLQESCPPFFQLGGTKFTFRSNHFYPVTLCPLSCSSELPYPWCLVPQHLSPVPLLGNQPVMSDSLSYIRTRIKKKLYNLLFMRCYIGALSCFVLGCFEARSHCVAQADLELVAFLAQPPEC